MDRGKIAFLSVALVLLTSAPPVFGQTVTAAIRGTVVDQQGGVLPGASVTARNIDTNVSRTVPTGSLGQFYLPNLPAGRYELSAELSGFTTDRRSEVTLQVGQERTVQFVLKVGTLEESVQVVGEVAALQTTQHTPATLIKKEYLDSLPTVGRAFTDLARLAPGVASTGAGDTLTSLNFAGQRGFGNGVYVDGVTNNLQHYGQGEAASFSQDWIQEFQVLPGSFAAEFGRAIGGILNVITRSGTNTLRARGYGFFRDHRLDSAPFAGYFTDGKPQYLAEAPPMREQRIGGFLGGPIVKNEVFYFAGVENLNRDKPVTLGISDYWRSQGVKTALPSTTTDLSYLVKVDMNLGTKNRLSVRYNQTHFEQTNGGGTLSTEEARWKRTGPRWHALGSWTSTLGNTSFNELRVSYTVDLPSRISNLSGLGGKAEVEAAPLDGSWTARNYPGATFGHFSGGAGLEGERTLTVTEQFSFVAGDHQVKVGAQLLRMSPRNDCEYFNLGLWSFPRDRVFNRNDPLSFPDSYTTRVGGTEYNADFWSPYLFMQDSWQVTDRLALNLGLRYDLDRTAPWGNELVDAANARYVTRYGGAPPLHKVKLDKNNVAPRLGLVWVLDDERRTTVRASAGIFYDQNHNNYNATYFLNSLLADQFVTFDANNPLNNPFYNPSDPTGSAAALRAFLASYYPARPDLSKAPAAKQDMWILDHNFQIPQTRSFTVGGGHAFKNGLSVQVDYVAQRSREIVTAIDDNLALVDGSYVRPDARFGRILNNKNSVCGAHYAGTASCAAWVRYDGLRTWAEFRKGSLNLTSAYTLSKTTSNTLGTSQFGANTNPLDPSVDEGPESFDRRHVFVLSGAYVLPLDFQVAGIWRMASALPWSVTSRYVVYARPEPRSSRRGDSEKTVDLRMSKFFRVGRARIDVFWEMFNALDTDSFTSYAGSLQSSRFGLPGSALDRRRQQAGFRIDF